MHTVYWRPYHEVYPKLPPEPDFVAFIEDQEESIGRAYLMVHGPFARRWRWTMDAHSHTGWVPFEIRGHEDSRGEAGRRVVEAYQQLLAHNEQHPRKAPRGPSATGGASHKEQAAIRPKLTVGWGR